MLHATGADDMGYQPSQKEILDYLLLTTPSIPRDLFSGRNSYVFLHCYVYRENGLLQARGCGRNGLVHSPWASAENTGGASPFMEQQDCFSLHPAAHKRIYFPLLYKGTTFVCEW